MFGKSRTVVGLDIGSSAVKAVELKALGKGYRVAAFGSQPVPPDSIVDGAIIDAGAVADAIRRVFEGNKAFKAKDVCASLSGNAVIVKKITLPVMTQSELDESIYWEAEQYIPFPTVTKTYNTPGTYGVTVVATDDLAQTGTGTASVTIAAAITFASTAFTFSPTAPVVDEEVIFTVNTITTSNGATINTYTWDVGDRSDLVSTSSSRVTHTFGRARTSFVVRLSVEDSLGRTATVTRDVTVAP